MEQSTLIFAVHGVFGAALLGVGGYRISVGDYGGVVNLIMAAGIFGLGLFMARRRS